MNNEKELAKLVEEAKVHKLMNRMCNGDNINQKQFNTIFEFVKAKGYPSTIEEEWSVPVWRDNELVQYKKEIRERPGFRYIGVFACYKLGDKILRYGDTRKCCFKYIKLYPNGELYRS